jgi:hypothetical protein
MAKIAFLKKLLPEMVKNRHFLPFFGPKTPFFRIFWHPVYPPSKTPFLAVLPPPPPRAGREPGGRRDAKFGGKSCPDPLSVGMCNFSIMKTFGMAVSRAS